MEYYITKNRRTLELHNFIIVSNGVIVTRQPMSGRARGLPSFRFPSYVNLNEHTEFIRLE